MGYVIAFFAVLVGLYFVAWLALAGFLWGLLPALIIAVPVAAGLGALGAAVSALLTLAGRRAGPATVTPEQVVDGSSGLPALRGDSPFGRDPAWPSYFSAQAAVDLKQIWVAHLDVLADGWQWIGRMFRGSWPGRIVVVLLFGPLWLGVSGGALAATAIILGVAALVLLALWGLWMVPTGLVRAADQSVRRLRKASGSCQTCYHVTALPAFACPGCGKLHRDVRPGRLGGLWRRCECGKVLPTSVLRIAVKSPPRCPRCDETLRAGAAVVTDVRLPVFGPVSAGKTRLVYSGLLAIRNGVAANGGTVDFVDEDSQQTFDHATSLISAGGDTAKTPAGELPAAITARYTAGRRRALLHLFDAAGEFYADRDDNTDLEFLDHAQGLVFVVDPFSIPWVRDQLGDAANSDVIARANPASDNPERVYHVTAKRLRDYGVATGKRRLAITVVKADLLDSLPLAGELRPGHIRDWLERAGMDNLVLGAERDFGEVEYFVVASLTRVQPTDPRSPAGPLAWLAAGAGLRLWPDPVVPAADPEVPDKQPEEAL
ncbi:hypothetical protein ACGFMK_13405 [Amycolatopsis sp. NPDC049252]|uniref:TRAFAC clade GTPase domain-containing protein n=1 Tax=Amycolatopsis sp. NPDC049252 TaxID=3363933 RepID=UPI00371393E3